MLLLTQTFIQWPICIIEIIFQTSTSFDASIDGWITFANSLGHTDISTRYLTTQAQRGIVGAITSTVIGNLVR